jgi:hypothetical protein
LPTRIAKNCILYILDAKKAANMDKKKVLLSRIAKIENWFAILDSKKFYFPGLQNILISRIAKIVKKMLSRIAKIVYCISWMQKM